MTKLKDEIYKMIQESDIFMPGIDEECAKDLAEKLDEAVKERDNKARKA